MAESWVRLWAGMTTDPKFRTIARKSGRPVIEVIGLFSHLLLIANEGVIRGDLNQLVVEDIASALDVDESAIQAMLDAMDGRVIENGRLSGWDKRQPVREDAGNPVTGAMSPAERKRKQRERMSRDVTAGHNKSRDVTAGHNKSRDVTAGHTPEADTEADTEKGVDIASVIPDSTEVALTTDDGARASPSPAGLTCKRLKAAGIAGVNPSHPKLLALLAAGLTPDEIASIAEEPNAKGKGMAWVLAAAEGRRRDAAVRPLPRASPGVADRNRQASAEAKRLIFGGG